MAALVFHALLAFLVASKVAPQVAEAPVMEISLVRLPPRATPPARRSEPAVGKAKPEARPAPGVGAPQRQVRTPEPAMDWRVRPSEGGAAETAPAALRAKLGCRHADLLKLTEAERVACQQALAARSETAPTYAVVSPKLKKVFDGTFECPKGDVWCEYRIGKAPYPGLLAPRKPPRDKTWDGN